MNNEHPSFTVRQEEENIRFRPVILSALVSLTLAGVLVFAAFVSTRTQEAQLRPSGSFPEERLGARRDMQGVHEDLFIGRGLGQALEGQKARELTHVAWVDKSKRIVRIPIDQAMDLVVEENRK